MYIFNIIHSKGFDTTHPAMKKKYSIIFTQPYKTHPAVRTFTIYFLLLG